MVIHLGLLIEQLLQFLDLLLAGQHALLVRVAGSRRTVVVGPRLMGLVHGLAPVVRLAIRASEVHQPHRLPFDCLDGVGVLEGVLGDVPATLLPDKLLKLLYPRLLALDARFSLEGYPVVSI